MSQQSLLFIRAHRDALAAHCSTIKAKKTAATSAVMKASSGSRIDDHSDSLRAGQHDEEVALQQLAELQPLLDAARVVDIDPSKDIVHFGVRVRMKGVGMRPTNWYWLVGPWSPSPGSGTHDEPFCLSYKSPLGRCILGMRLGETRTYVIGDVNREVTILAIE